MLLSYLSSDAASDCENASDHTRVLLGLQLCFFILVFYLCHQGVYDLTDILSVCLCVTSQNNSESFDWI